MYFSKDDTTENTAIAIRNDVKYETTATTETIFTTTIFTAGS